MCVLELLKHILKVADSIFLWNIRWAYSVCHNCFRFGAAVKQQQRRLFHVVSLHHYCTYEEHADIKPIYQMGSIRTSSVNSFAAAATKQVKWVSLLRKSSLGQELAEKRKEEEEEEEEEEERRWMCDNFVFASPSSAGDDEEGKEKEKKKTWTWNRASFNHSLPQHS